MVVFFASTDLQTPSCLFFSSSLYTTLNSVLSREEQEFSPNLTTAHAYLPLLIFCL